MLLVAMRNVSKNSYSVELSENFCHMQKDRRFVKIVKSHSGHPKSSKSIKKPEAENFWDSNTFFLCSILLENKKIKIIKGNNFFVFFQFSRGKNIQRENKQNNFKVFLLSRIQTLSIYLWYLWILLLLLLLFTRKILFGVGAMINAETCVKLNQFYLN